MAKDAGAKSIIVFDEKMSKAPLEQQNKSGTQWTRPALILIWGLQNVVR